MLYTVLFLFFIIEVRDKLPKKKTLQMLDSMMADSSVSVLEGLLGIVRGWIKLRRQRYTQGARMNREKVLEVKGVAAERTNVVLYSTEPMMQCQ